MSVHPVKLTEIQKINFYFCGIMRFMYLCTLSMGAHAWPSTYPKRKSIRLKWNTTSEKSRRNGNRSGWRTRPTESLKTNHEKSSMCSTCFPTRREQDCTWAIRWATLPATYSPVSNGCKALTCSTPWATMPTDCPPSSMPYRRGFPEDVWFLLFQ